MKSKWTILILLALSLSLMAQTSDSDMLAAYQRQDMGVWKAYVESSKSNVESQKTVDDSFLLYEYGYCGYIVAEAKKEGNEALLPEAKRYVQNFKSQITNYKSQLPVGHYEMYMSAVYVYELRLKESIHPVKAMQLAKEAVRLAPNDPLTLSYYGTCLFYAPKPFGSKKEALEYFEEAEKLFRAPQWKYRWERAATLMYIDQCHEKLKKQ